MPESVEARISRDEMLVRMAVIVSERGTCLRAHVGAVIAKDGRVISTGYVGAPSGLPHCLEVGCDISEFSGCIRTVHAEANAIAWAARNGLATDGSTLYCTHSPCANCAKLIINAGIERVVYCEEYRDMKPLAMLGTVGIQIERHA
jgi:dCMP deaminase